MREGGIALKQKKILAVLLAIAIIASSLALGLSAFAKTNSAIALDVIYTDKTEGAEDKIWYTFTPEASGNYAFISYSVGKSEAYLFTRTVNPDGSRVFNQLAYAPAKDPDYLNNYNKFTYLGKTYTHSSTAFYLPCYLRAGTTYYFAAGWAPDSTTSGTINARLTNINYEDIAIKSVAVECDATLSAFTDGEWRVDSKGERYYYYNFSKILQNMEITVTYNDGSVSKCNATDEEVDGYKISIKQNQIENHWYVQGSNEYVANTISIEIGTVKCDYDVMIKNSAMYVVKGKVVDYSTGNPIQNATILLNNGVAGTTDANGLFTFAYASGNYKLTIKTATSVNYVADFTIDSLNSQNNDYTSKPFRLVNIDFVDDEVINAKDYAFALKNDLTFDGKLINFKPNKY